VIVITAPAELTEAQVEARIRMLREHRAAKAAAEGTVPAAVHMTGADIGEALDKADATQEEKPSVSRASVSPQEQRVLDAARSLYGGSGVARPSEIATKLGVKPVYVSCHITNLRRKGAWPYASPLKGRPAGEPMKPKGKPKPNLARLDEPRQASRPAVEDVPAAVDASGVYEAMLAALDAVNALPGEAKAALTLYLSNRSK
jgi:DNA-binding CsgD family transcriptional regulator